MLEAFGLPVLASAVVDGPDEAVAAFTTAGRPVALKAVADGVLHKATAGGVRLGLDTADARAAWLPGRAGQPLQCGIEETYLSVSR